MIALGEYTLDDDLITAVKRTGQPHVNAYRFPCTAIVVGRGSRLHTELNVKAVEADNVPVLKRRGGGCSVVLDTGNVIVSCAFPIPGLGGTKRAFSRLSSMVIDALSKSGAHGVRRVGVSDLVLGDRKIGGACIYRSLGLLYYSTTLLYKPNLDLVNRYLRHPPREPDYRAGRRHDLFMGSLSETGKLGTIDQFAATICDTLQSGIGNYNSWDLTLTQRQRETV